MIGQSPQGSPHANVTEPLAHSAQDAPADTGETPPANGATAQEPPREWGGREGPEPTRYGDWEKNGRCIDF